MKRCLESLLCIHASKLYSTKNDMQNPVTLLQILPQILKIGKLIPDDY